ncbi:response regulator [Labilibacter sediminis]|nr:response regulator [Labilibacter sediminis]
MIIRFLLIINILFLFLGGARAHVSKDSLFFRAIKPQDGLPGSTVSTFTQDSLNFMWIGTNDGLCRYDGSHFRIYRNQPNNLNSLIDNDVQKIHLDSKSNLWIMTAEGLHYFDLKKSIIERIHANGSVGAIADDSPIDIVESKDGDIYIASYYSGISYRRSHERQFKYLNTSMEDESRLSSDNIKCLTLSGDSLLFIGFQDKGIDIYNTKTKQTNSLVSITGTHLLSEQINDICKNGDKGIWIGTKAGISYYDIESNRLVNYNYSGADYFLSDHDIASIFLDRDGYLWIGTQNKGLSVVHQEDVFLNGRASSITHYYPALIDGSLSYRTVLTVFQDDENQIWIGTHGGGINYVENKFHRFSHLKHNPGVKTSLSYNKVWGLAEDTEGNVWVGTDGDGINIWNESNRVIKRFRHNPKDSNSLSDNAIICAKRDFKGNMWIGTYEGGLNRYDGKTHKFIRYQAPNDLPRNDIRCIYEDPDHRLWVGMNRGGVALYDPEKDVFKVIEELSFYDVRSILVDNDILWLGTYGDGFVKYNLKNKEVVVYYSDSDQTDLPILKTVYTIYNSNDNFLWLGTKDAGLLKMNAETGQFENFSEADGLPNNNVHCILPDPKGNLWLSTNSGISQFNLNDQRITNFNWTKGVQNEEFHDGSGLITRNGLYCFGGINGMNYFRPVNFRANISSPIIRFTNLKILNQEIFPDENEIITKGVEYSPVIKLNHNHSVFTIDFQSLHYPFSEDAKYKYILQGYDTEWNNAGKLNSATYRNLPAGDYTFKVRSYGDDSNIQTDEASLQIEMAPAFYKTKIAYTLYILIAIFNVIAIFRFRVNQYKIKNKLVYEKKLRNKEKNLHDERLEFFTNISHELRTPITIIGVALDDIAAMKTGHPKIRKSIDAALKNSNRLMELINKLLEFRQVETGVSSLSVSEFNLNNYLKDFLQGFREMAKHNNIHLRLSLPINDLFIWLDQDKFSMILNNILSNAFKHTPTGGSISLSVDENENNITVKVRDTGTGISKHIQSKIFNRYFKQDNASTSTGIGLALTKSLIDLLHGEITVESSSGKGCTFIMKFLKGKSHFAANQIMDQNEIVDMTGAEKEPDMVEDDILKRKDQEILLLVDDNQEIIDLLYDKFCDDYSILKAFDGDEGVKLAKMYLPDLIISDIMMPNKSGIELCDDLKNDATTSHIPIILLTAKGTEEDEIRGLDIGADDYISKPFKISILKARINAILENRIKIYNYFNKNNHHEIVEEAESPETNKEMEFLNKVENYILTKCLNSEVSVFELASDLGFSRTTLYRKIKNLTGMSINAFVRSVKLKKSAELITAGMNVSEAAYSTGFNDLKYFRESFKKLFKKNPSEFK